MGLTCGMKCLKYLMFAFNFVFWISGIVVLGVGIYSRVKSKDWNSILGNDGSIISVANLLIASGIIVMVIGFLGCCGAMRENKFLLTSYAILLVLIFIMEIAAGIYAYVKKDKVIKNLEINVQNSILRDYGGPTTAQKGLAESVDYVQKELKCCGSTSARDWSASKWYNEYKKPQNITIDHEMVPKSCCKDSKIKNCNVATNVDSLQNTTFSEGCITSGRKFVNSHVLEIGGVGVGIAFVQLLGIVFAVLLCRNIRYEKV